MRCAIRLFETLPERFAYVVCPPLVHSAITTKRNQLRLVIHRQSLSLTNMAANALPMALGAAFAGAAAYSERRKMPTPRIIAPRFSLAMPAFAVVFLKPADPVLARADSNAGAKKKTLVRRHSSGDHAFLPTRGETTAKKLAGRGGIQEGQVADSEVMQCHPLKHPPARAQVSTVFVLMAGTPVAECARGVAGEEVRHEVRLLCGAMKSDARTLCICRQGPPPGMRLLYTRSCMVV